MTAATGAHGGLTAAQWIDEGLHRLKTEEGAAAKLLAGMERQLDNGPVLAAPKRADLDRAAGYIGNNLNRMDHAAVREKLPIGSGVTGPPNTVALDFTKVKCCAGN